MRDTPVTEIEQDVSADRHEPHNINPSRPALTRRQDISVGQNSMNASWTIGRVIAFTLSLLLLGFGVKCIFDGHRLKLNFEQWQTAKPVDGVIDLSVPGRFVLRFDQTCSSSHGETVALRVPPEALQGTTNTQLLAGLSAKLDITDKSGNILTESTDSKAVEGEKMLDGAIPIFDLAPFRKGAYHATVTVITGAPALKGIAQRLEGRYLLCGLERLPATIASGIGVVCAGVGTTVGVIVLLRTARYRRHPPDGQQGAAPPTAGATHSK